ncbi:MAG: NAD-dependent epimerase/dehydratase family protein [Kiritimatiellae bacterium]|nr:NAD-dependent epimerase/dehydratase family protein [Kiritimatiellia bacterium]
MSSQRKRIIIAGGSGFLGRNLAAHFAPDYDVVVLTRGAAVGPHARAVLWDAKATGPWVRELDGAAVLINLTGRSVNCRYNATNKQAMMTSRIASTRILGEAVANGAAPPPVWINSSTATIYKHTLGAPHAEDGDIGATPCVKDAFAVDIAQRWEAAFFEAACPGVRVGQPVLFQNNDNIVLNVHCVSRHSPAFTHAVNAGERSPAYTFVAAEVMAKARQT